MDKTTEATERRTASVFLLVMLVVIGTLAGLSFVQQSQTMLSAPSDLAVGVRLNATSIQSGQALTIYIWLANTADKVNNVSARDGFVEGLEPWGCEPYQWPLRFGILVGHYTQSNISEGTWLPSDWRDYNCSIYSSIQVESVSFKPQSEVANITSLLGNQTNILSNVTLNDTDVVPGTLYPSISSPGMYTVVVGDEWGQVASAIFSVES